MTETTDQAARRNRYDAAIREAEGWVLDDGQHMLDAVLAVADAEQAELCKQNRASLRRADEAGARAAAMERAMQSTAADALKHRGCHRDLMGQCLRAEKAEAAIERVRSVLESEAVVGRSALDYRGLITSALMADEAQQPETQADDEPPCTCAAAGDCFAPAGHYADCPAAVSQPGKEPTS
jgi:hypothetical protein